MKQKYIMSEEEYEALDTYLTAAKMYDADCYICQVEESDYGFYDDVNEVVCLKEFIDTCYHDNCVEDLVGYKGFTKGMIKTIDKLYAKLEYVDKSFLPSSDKSWKALFGD